MAEGPGQGRAALRHKAAELIVAGFFLLLGALVIVDSLRLGIGWQQRRRGERSGGFDLRRRRAQLPDGPQAHLAQNLVAFRRHRSRVITMASSRPACAG